MTKAIITHEVHGVIVGQRKKDNYVNATALASAYLQATGTHREVKHWLANARTQESIEHLSAKVGIPTIQLYQVKRGSPENGGGTWIHPKLAVRFAIWLSDEFGYMVEEWFSNQLEAKPMTEQESARLQGKQARRSLTDAIKDYIERHPELSENKVKFLYSNTTDALYRAIFAMSCKQLKENRNIESVRDSLPALESITLAAMEDLTARLIDEDREPKEAVAEASSRMMVHHRFAAS